MPGFSMTPGSKEKDTEGNFSEKDTNRIQSVIVDINEVVVDPEYGTRDYAMQRQSAGGESKYITREGLDVTPSEETISWAAQHRAEKAAARRERLGIKTAY